MDRSEDNGEGLGCLLALVAGGVLFAVAMTITIIFFRRNL